ncbi:MAG TPA: substrate-binding domain-containing protein [Vicinamibacteria bacterium]|jgi:ABC-type sugar transport system substrate-binding protein|nr:substrate-binding domain-containing protein [Vicinamibacteria bacterium]
MAERIVVSLTTADQEYQALQGEDAKDAGRRLGVDVEVLFAEDVAVMQIQQIFRFVHAGEGERPAALLVHTRVPDGLERVARNAVQAGIGWILLNRSAPYVEALRRERPAVAVAAVTTDHVEVGRIHARQLAQLCPDGAHVLYVQGPADASAASLRLQGLEEALRGRPYELKVVNGEWTAASAEKAIAGWLRLRTSDLFQPTVVVCQNDVMARGARAALERLRPEWARLPFLGCDGLPKGGRLDVEQGRLAATITMPSCASPAIDLAVKWIRTGAMPPAQTVLAPSAYPAR